MICSDLQGSPNPFVCPAEFSCNPNLKHLKQLIKLLNMQTFFSRFFFFLAFVNLLEIPTVVLLLGVM